ncbi:MAG TPA: DUF1579 domain-containing protein [Flavitalea sp.]|nr:DUF1579 domain-containing protein [Flavitalea sp.]
MSLDKFAISKTSGVHYQLSKLEGKWEGTTRTWFEQNQVADESPMKGSIKSVLDGRFMLYEYEGSISGKSLNGIAIIGFSISDDKFQMAWVDSFHMGTGIMLSQGKKPDMLFSVLGNYGSTEMPEPWGWRTEMELKDADTLIVTAYNITPNGEEAKATETIYTRKP